MGLSSHDPRHPPALPIWLWASLQTIGPVIVTLAIVLSMFLFILMPQYENHLLEARKTMIREQVNTVWQLVADYHRREVAGEFTREEAQERAIGRIRNLRYGPEAKDYFWINDRHPHMIMHPYRSDLDGRDVADYVNPDGMYLFRHFVQAVGDTGSSFVRYLWQRHEDPGRIEAKQAYLRLFAPWDWVIGTGMYTDDVTRQLADIRRHILLSFGAAFLFIVLMAMQIVRRSIRVESERQAALTALHASERQLAGIIEFLPDATLVIDHDGRIIAWNKAMERLSGRDAPEMLGKGDFEYALPFFNERRPILIDYLADAGFPDNQPAGFYHSVRRTGHALSAELSVPHGPGRGRYLFAIAAPLFDNMGAPAGAIESIRDITDRHQAEEARRENEEHLRIVLDAIGDAVIATDAAGCITRVNRMARILTGQTAADLCGRHIDEAIVLFRTLPDGRRQTSRFSVREALQQGGGETPTQAISSLKTQPTQAILLSRAGMEYAIADTCAPIRTPDNAVVGSVIVFRDITHEVAMEEALRQKQKLEAIGQLAGGIAHDFNNLLGGIISATELLARIPASTEAQRTYITLIRNTAERAGNLTGQLLAFSRKGRILNVPTDLHAIIADVLSICERSFDPRISVVRDLAAERDTILGDPSQLQNAILNLCINARDAMPSGGVLRLSTRNGTRPPRDAVDDATDADATDFIIIDVHDSGTGIPSDVMPRIFDPFYTTKPLGEGTGLGLPAVLGTIKSHRGAVSVRSIPGQGTSFSLYLPLAPAERHTAPGAAPAAAPAVTGSTILLADDEAVVRDTTAELLREMGHRVITARDGIDCCEQYEAHRDTIDLVLLDVMMPRLNGIETFRRLRAGNPDLRIALMTGFPDAKTCAALEQCTIDAFLKKPFTRNRLEHAIHDALTAPRPGAGTENRPGY